jgi:hypothetical protein
MQDLVSSLKGARGYEHETATQADAAQETGACFAIIAVLISALLTIGPYVLTVDWLREGLRQRIRDAVAIAARRLDGNVYATLPHREQQDEPTFKRLRHKLQQIRDAGKGYRYVHAQRRHAGVYPFGCEDSPKRKLQQRDRGCGSSQSGSRSFPYPKALSRWSLRGTPLTTVSSFRPTRLEGAIWRIGFSNPRIVWIMVQRWAGHQIFRNEELGMSTVRTYEGVVVNGQIRLGDDVRLPEYAQVFVVVPGAVAATPLQIHSPRLVDRSQIDDFAKEVRVVEDDARV